MCVLLQPMRSPLVHPTVVLGAADGTTVGAGSPGHHAEPEGDPTLSAVRAVEAATLLCKYHRGPKRLAYGWYGQGLTVAAGANSLSVISWCRPIRHCAGPVRLCMLLSDPALHYPGRDPVGARSAIALTMLPGRLQIRCQNRSSASGCRDPAFQRRTSPRDARSSPNLVGVDIWAKEGLPKNNGPLAPLAADLRYGM
jgi:hypothetical protein